MTDSDDIVIDLTDEGVRKRVFYARIGLRERVPVKLESLPADGPRLGTGVLESDGSYVVQLNELVYRYRHSDLIFYLSRAYPEEFPPRG